MKRRGRENAKKKSSRVQDAGDASGFGSGYGQGFTPDFDCRENNEIRPIVALWRAVLAQHIMDAKSRSSKPEAAYYRHKALHFLFDDNKDFRTVCELADFNPDVVRQKLRDARERGFIWRAGDGEQPTRREVVARGEDKRAVLIEFGLFPKLPKHAPVKQRNNRRAGNHMQALRQFSTQMELVF